MSEGSGPVGTAASCPSCDQPLVPGAQFCPRCGAQVSAVGATPRSSRSVLIAALVVATVGLLIAGIVVALSFSSDDDPGAPIARTEIDDRSDRDADRSDRDDDRSGTVAEEATSEATVTEADDREVDRGSATSGGSSGFVGDCATLGDGYPNAVDSFRELDLTGLTVNVASKDFVEQFVLGQLLIVALERAGAQVIDNVNLGGTIVNRDALLANEIDAYWEYTGTGLSVHLGSADPSFDRLQLADNVCVGDLAENGIRWLGISPFNNTYGFATAGDGLATGLDLQGMADYVAVNPDAIVCMETEYPNRPDGLVLFERATDFRIPDDQITILETAAIYGETANGNCTFGEVFTTDGRIPALGLDVVDDPGVHILYHASLTMPDTVYRQAPAAFQAIAETILQPLDNDAMAELNRQVSVDGDDPRVVAERFLTDRGLLS